MTADASASDLGARRALAEMVRQLAAATVAADVADEVLVAAAVAVRATVEQLRAAAAPGVPAPVMLDASGAPQELFARSPATGLDNPTAPSVRLWREGDAIAGEAWFDHQFEGPPTCVHGGVIAMVFDDLLGMAALVSGNPGMTRTLQVRYRRPTPLRQPIRLSASCTAVDGRTVELVASMWHDEVMTAEASGVFIAVGLEGFAAIAERHGGSGAAAQPAGNADASVNRRAAASPSELE